MKANEIYVVECINKKSKNRTFYYYSKFISARRQAEYLINFNYTILVYPANLITE